MKKLLSAFLCLLFVLSLSACGNHPSVNEEPDKTMAEEGGINRLAAFYDKYLKDGEYTMTVSTDGRDAFYAVSGDKVYAASEIAGHVVNILINEDALYLLDPETKTGLKLPKDGLDKLKSPFDHIFVSDSYIAAEGEIYGETYYFEDHSDEESGVSVCYYFDGPMLKYVVTDYDVKNPVELLEIKKGADKSFFSLPDDYVVTDADSLPEISSDGAAD